MKKSKTRNCPKCDGGALSPQPYGLKCAFCGYRPPKHGGARSGSGRHSSGLYRRLVQVATRTEAELDLIVNNPSVKPLQRGDAILAAIAREEMKEG